MAEPANRKTNAAGGKFYTHPITKEQFDSVTTALDVFDKAALKQWAANLAARAAIDHLPSLVRATMEAPCERSNNQCVRTHGKGTTCERCPCGVCEDCWYRRLKNQHYAESSRRSQEGTELHEAAHFWVLNGGSEVTIRQEVMPYWRQFLQWTRDYNLRPRGGPFGTDDDPGSWEYTETTVLNRVYRYAGTSDGAVWLLRGRSKSGDEMLDRLGTDSALVRVDYKTREKDEVQLFNDMPLQLVAYDRCDTAMADDGTERPLPDTDACAILQLRPSGYTFRLAVVNDETFDAFVNALAVYRWLAGPAKMAMDLEAFPVPATPPDRRHLHVKDAPDVGEWVDPWEKGHIGPEPEPVAAEPPAPPTAKAPTKRQREAAERKAAREQVAKQQQDAWAAHNNAAQTAADDAKRPATTPTTAAPSAILESLRAFDPGKPVNSRRGEPLPF